MIDDDGAFLRLRAVGWSQILSNDEDYPPRQFNVVARTADNESLLFNAKSQRPLQNMSVHLSVLSGLPEKPPKRGIGVLAYYPERPASRDIEKTEEFLGGWFWLENSVFDEVWVQVRENRYDECEVEVEFAPVEVIKFEILLGHFKK